MVAALLVGALGCGDEDPPPQQAVFWLGLSAPVGATCASADTFQYPATAQQTIASTTGNGERIVDGDDLVSCQVSPAASGGGAFDVNFDFATDVITSFSASGRLDAAGGEIDINLVTPGFALEQDSCTATVKTILPGAVWIQSLNCPDLVDPRSPGIRCTGVGGLIFENCSR